MKAQLLAPKMIVFYLFFVLGSAAYLRGDASVDEVGKYLVVLAMGLGVLKVEEFRRAVQESKR